MYLPENCIDCPSHVVRADPDPTDWFCSDDVKVWCYEARRFSTVACRPHHAVKETTPVPSWCPRREEEKKVEAQPIEKPDVVTLTKRQLEQYIIDNDLDDGIYEGSGTMADVIREAIATNHPIIDVGDHLRFKELPEVKQAIFDLVGVDNLNDFAVKMRGDKNNIIYRALYKAIGYSIYGYWEIFYWEMNNDDWKDYELQNYTTI